MKIDTKTFWNYRNNENYVNYFPIFTYVEDRIKNQLNEGGLLNAFNPMLVARINGIKDKQDITTNDKDFNVTVNLTKEEARNIAESLDNDL